jgi:pyruvate,water dikinase
LAGLEKNYVELKKIAEQRIANEFMTIAENGNIRIATDSELREVKTAIEQQAQRSDIQGNVACRGAERKYVANVKVLRSAKECPKVERGEVLVASMTTPDYMPAMDRALGFITDEGGVTCHAAIVAREMNKPCIIGTMNATHLLKDGDKVEIDVLNGTVRILK